LLTLQTAEADIAANDVLGKISFQAPNEGTGTDAILIAAAIQAISEGDFSSSSNATSLAFMTGASEAAATKMTLSSAGNLTLTGVITANAGVVVDEMTLDADTLTATDTFTIDAVGNIILDSDGGEILLKDGGSNFGRFFNSGQNLFINNQTADKDITFQGVSGGANVNALILDMSDAGTAIFSHNLLLPSSGELIFTSGGSFPRISNATSDTALSFFTSGTERFQIATDGGISTLTAGSNNVRLGANAGDSIASGGNENVCVGDNAGTAITTGDHNTIVGFDAGKAIVGTARNTILGYAAGKDATGSGNSENVYIGNEAAFVITSGIRNTIVGGSSGGALVGSNADNTFVGQGAGSTVTSGDANTILGRYNGNQGSLDIRTSSNNIVLSDGDGVPRMRIGSTGAATLGGATIDSTKTLKLQNVDQNNAASYAIHSIGRQTGANGRVQIWSLPNTSNSGAYFVFAENEAANVFNIRGTGNVQNANNSYGSTSDVKLKENIQDASSQWDDIKSLQVRKYSFISENLDAPNQLGVIAQELESSGMSGLVETNADIDPHTGEDFGTTTKTVKYSILYMKAVKALQEAMDRIETLETKVTALEGA